MNCEQQLDFFKPAKQEGIPQPATQKQREYARRLAKLNSVELPESLLSNRVAISRWIHSQNPIGTRAQSTFNNYPSSKQVAFAERIARIKQRNVPRECFQDRGLMSRWIDSNK